MRSSSRHHPFRLPSLHRLNTKDLAAPPTTITNSPPGSGYQPLTTPPAATISHDDRRHQQHHRAPSSPTLSPSSTTSSELSTTSFGTNLSSKSADSSSSSGSLPRIRHMLMLRRKQSRIDIEREIADERSRFGAGPSGGLMSVMEPRPDHQGRAGGVVMGGIFEVLGAHH